MRTYIYIGILMHFFITAASGQYSDYQAVRCQAQVQLNPPSITLKWTDAPGTVSYTIYRKTKSAKTWGNLIAQITPPVLQWKDTNVVKGNTYEYRIIRGGANGQGFGYVYAGIQAPAQDQSGSIYIAVDSLIASELPMEVNRLKNDLRMEGWKVQDEAISPSASVTTIRAKINTAYQQGAGYVLLLGHIPVPYSGDLAPDGHPDHIGAWPADAYYADVNGIWTDNVVNDVAATDPRNKNAPGDGKFDQSNIASDLEMGIGRVDFRNMPAFGLSEVQLMKRYLDKNHKYRTGGFQVKRRGIVQDNFASYSEGFAQNGLRNFPPFVGIDSTKELPFHATLKDQDYLWAYGCGPGWYQGAGGITTSGELALDSLKGIFTMIFGSYHGDWDTQDNLLRSALASGSILTTTWAGRPHWHFHHMALGEPIGYSALLSMNNSGLYTAGFAPRGVHMALLGDPTLKSQVVRPVISVSAVEPSPGDISISWGGSPDATDGYVVYQKGPNDNTFVFLAEVPGANSITTQCNGPGNYVFMVRAKKLEQNASGSYYQLSPGVTDTLEVQGYLPAIAEWKDSVYFEKVYFSNTSKNVTDYAWDFGDGNLSGEQNPVYMYPGAGTYQVCMYIQNTCSADTQCTSVQTISSIPTVDANMLQPTCPGGTGSIQLTLTGGAAPFQIQWNPAVDPKNCPPGSYSAIITSVTGKSITVGPYIINTAPSLQMIQLPKANVIPNTKGDACCILIPGSLFPFPYQVVWGSITDTCQVGPGNYELDVINTIYNCVWAKLQVNVPVKSSVIEAILGFQSRMYPNPASRQLHIYMYAPNHGLEGSRFQIVNGLGEVVFNQPLTTGEFDQYLDINNWFSGQYNCMIIKEGKAYFIDALQVVH